MLGARIIDSISGENESITFISHRDAHQAKHYEAWAS